ncbi:MAG: hypothetical protein HY702_00560 [Gemmatimonadetes bacterium]|nr:hypothetical protein [Gemmatimonadota bacterium]
MTWSPLKSASLALTLLLCAHATKARAQELAWLEPRTWLTGWFGGLFPDDVADPATGTWILGDNVGGGLELSWRVAPSAFLTADLSYTRTGYDRESPVDPGTGDADVLAGGVGLRYHPYTGPGVLLWPFGVLGLGLVGYRLTEFDDLDTDFSILTGAGLEWRLSLKLRLVIAGYDFLVFHQRPEGGRKSNTNRLRELRVGLRWGL